MKTKVIVVLLAACVFSICATEIEAQTRRGRAPRSSSAPKSSSATSAAVTTSTGLTYLITKKGTGRQLKAGDTVILHYTGTLTNGVKFDSSYDHQQTLSFKLGTGRVIKGWDEGVAKLHVGDHAILVIPSKLAYGPQGIRDVIPPDATLIFMIEVVDVQ